MKTIDELKMKQLLALAERCIANRRDNGLLTMNEDYLQREIIRNMNNWKLPSIKCYSEITK